MPATDLKIVLVHPEQPRNVGAAVRAAANFGISGIVVVRDSAYSSEELKDITVSSAGATNLVKIATHRDLPDALADSHFVVGTSGRTRGTEIPRASQLHTLVPPTAGSIAVLFGRESQGLSAAEMGYCHALVSLPVSADFPSLNLSHAVAILLYDWTIHAPRASEEKQSAPGPTAPQDLQERWLQQLPETTEPIQAQLRRLLNRADPTHEDMALLFNLTKKLRRKKNQ